MIARTITKPAETCFEVKVSKPRGVAKYCPNPTIAKRVGILEECIGISARGQSG